MLVYDISCTLKNPVLFPIFLIRLCCSCLPEILSILFLFTSTISALVGAVTQSLLQICCWCVVQNELQRLWSASIGIVIETFGFYLALGCTIALTLSCKTKFYTGFFTLLSSGWNLVPLSAGGWERDGRSGALASWLRMIKRSIVQILTWEQCQGALSGTIFTVVGPILGFKS